MDETTTRLLGLSADEFDATVNILREAPVAMYQNGVLTTGWEPVADGDFAYQRAPQPPVLPGMGP